MLLAMKHQWQKFKIKPIFIKMHRPERQTHLALGLGRNLNAIFEVTYKAENLDLSKCYLIQNV